MVSDILVHGGLAPVLWAYGEAEHHSREQWWLGTNEKKERQWSASQYILQGMPPVIYFLQLGPTSECFSQLPMAPSAGDQAFNTLAFRGNI
jgi:hypothetical protein